MRNEKVVSIVRNPQAKVEANVSPTAQTVAELAEILSRLDQTAPVFGWQLKPVLVVRQDSGGVLLGQ